MHEGQVEVPEEAVAAAVAALVPALAGQPVRRMASAGTTVAPFRVGDGHVARLPLVPAADDGGLPSAGENARELAGLLPLDVSHLVAVGGPFAGYPGTWSVWTYVEGEPLDALLDEASPDVDLDRLVVDLARALVAVRSLPTGGASWSGGGRGGAPLADSEWVRTSIERSSHLVDPRAATAVWERALAAPPHSGPPVRIHADAMPGNLLLRGGRLSGLVDISRPVVGDPASDLQPAWEVFDEPQRRRFRDLMGLDDAAWERGRGWAFETAIGGLHYYERSNPVFFRLCRHTLDRLLSATSESETRPEVVEQVETQPHLVTRDGTTS